MNTSLLLARLNFERIWFYFIRLKVVVFLFESSVHIDETSLAINIMISIFFEGRILKKLLFYTMNEIVF